jgi:hypothetical protein
MEYLKVKINELQTNGKNQNIRDLYRGINNFKKGYQPRTEVVKDEKGDTVADSHSILARWRNHSWPWDTFPDACPSYQVCPWVVDNGNPTIYSGQLRNKQDFPDE